MKKTLFLLLILILSTAGTATAADIIINGSFETGDFSGWGTKDMAEPYLPLTVQAIPTTDGIFAAIHGFDGGGPDTIEIFQDVNIPSKYSAILTFDWRAAWVIFPNATGARLFDVVIQPAGGGTPLLVTNILTANPNTSSDDTLFKSETVDLSEFAGSSVRINFRATIPESFTGPAQLELDNVVLDIELQLPIDIAVSNIDKAIEEKTSLLNVIDEAIAKEKTAQDALEEMLNTKDFGDLQKGDIVKAQEKIHSAIQHQEQSQKDLEKSIEKLEDALEALGVEPQLTLDPNLVAWWKLDETSGSTAYDTTGNNHGTLYGNPVWTTGQIAGALDFGGDDGVYLNTSAGTGSPLNIYNTDLTISAWVKVRGTGGTIIARAKPLAIAYRINVDTKVYINTYLQGPGHWVLGTNDIIAPDTWYHVAGVFNRTSHIGQVYVNGIKQAEGAMTTDPLSNDAPTKIGCRNDTGDFAFNGVIDDVRIYNKVLSAEEIQALYQAGL